MKQQYIDSSYRQGESHRLAYTEWGDVDNPELLFCAHGLSRNSRDFDVLAAAMADRYHVVCLDYPGRGRSQKLANAEDYDNLNYLTDSLNLLKALDKQAVDWAGTSMGGILGMGLAGMENAPIRKLVLNDVGTFISEVALREIAAYLGEKPHFSDLIDARKYFETNYASYGPLTSEQIDHLSEHGVWALESGGYKTACDDAIIDRFIDHSLKDVDLWPYWDLVHSPVLVIRGEYSQVLSAKEMAKMAASRRGVRAVEFPLCGHAPSLMHPDHIRTIRQWLLETTVSLRRVSN